MTARHAAVNTFSANLCIGTFYFLSIAGFIDFIVDPSFQVMGDMLDMLLVPLQQKRSDDEDEDESVTKINRATNTGSAGSIRSSDSVTGSPSISDRGIG